MGLGRMIRGGEGAGGPGSAHPNKAAAMCTRAHSRCATARGAGGERREIDKPVERMILRGLESPAPRIEVLCNLTQDLDVTKLTTTAGAGPGLKRSVRWSHVSPSLQRKADVDDAKCTEVSAGNVAGTHRFQTGACAGRDHLAGLEAHATGRLMICEPQHDV